MLGGEEKLTKWEILPRGLGLHREVKEGFRVEDRGGGGRGILRPEKCKNYVTCQKALPGTGFD